MTKDYSFLPLLINEEIYLARETSDSYKEIHTIIPNESSVHQVDAFVSELIFQGKNQKQVVVLVDHPGVEFATTQHEVLLRNILSAMNLNINDIALINMANAANRVDIAGLKKIGCKALIGFGIDPNKLETGQIMDSNKLMELENIKILWSYSLKDLQHDKEKKMSLWRNLKVMFDL